MMIAPTSNPKITETMGTRRLVALFDMLILTFLRQIPCFFMGGMPCHQQAQFLLSSAFRRNNIHNFSVVDNSYAVRNVHYFVEFKRNQQNGFAVVTLFNQAAMDKLDCTDIQSSCR